ncbi:MAG: M48 family metalloprotease [Neptuniibacter sp.]
MWKNKLTVVSYLLMLLALSGCQVNNINLKPLMDATSKSSDMFGKTLEEEVQMGEDVSSVLLKDSYLYNVKDVQMYVSKVGMWVAHHSERREVPWKFAVIRDDSFNAYATPGGNIFITTGTLDNLENEAELASVLAHEIAHVVRKHHLHAIQKEASVGVALDLARFVRDSKNDESSSSLGLMSEHTPETKFINSLQDIYSNGLARSDELEADRMGMVIAARAGYDPLVYINVLQKIGAYRSGKDEFWEKYLKRHPSADERLKALSPTVEKLSAAQGEILQKRYTDRVR